MNDFQRLMALCPNLVLVTVSDKEALRQKAEANQAMEDGAKAFEEGIPCDYVFCGYSGASRRKWAEGWRSAADAWFVAMNKEICG